MAPGFSGSSRFRQSWGWLRAQSTVRSEKGHFRRPLNWGPIGRRDGFRRKSMIGSTIKFDVAEEYKRELDGARAPFGRKHSDAARDLQRKAGDRLCRQRRSP